MAERIELCLHPKPNHKARDRGFAFAGAAQVRDGVAQTVAVFHDGQIAGGTGRPKVRHQLAVEVGEPVFYGAGAQ
jgi:hypothetical protein